jgi:CheY-like chemotaxis protein
LIDAQQAIAAVAKAGRVAGMRTLWESGLDRMWQGLTTIEELVRVLGERVQEDGSTLPDRPSVMLVPDQVRAVVAAAAEAVPAGRSRILVADDDPQMRRLVRTVLERDGFEVVEAQDGLDALDLINQQHIDLVVLDVDMPRLDGISTSAPRTTSPNRSAPPP